MNLTYDELRISYQTDEQLARALFVMLVIQEAKLEQMQKTIASQADNKRREYRA